MSEELRPYGNVDTVTRSAFKQRRCTLPIFHPEYIPPTPEEIQALITLGGWSQVQVAKLVGVGYKPNKGSTTVRRWRSPVDSPSYRQIPYAAWRLLLCYAHVVSIDADTAMMKTQSMAHHVL